MVQYDDGLLVDFPNCIVFSAGGKPDLSIPIPLVSDRHNYTGQRDKKYLASFMGNVKTHPIREKMVTAFSGNESIFISNGSVKEFEEVTAQSYFCLCPRGYGKTSFRLYEAMELGAVPVYISDEHWIPFSDKLDWTKFCIFEDDDLNNIKRLPKVMKSIVDSGVWYEMLGTAAAMYDSLFEYDKCFEVMKGIIENDYNKRKA